nr:hypothetical protein [Nanoarchaeum sp.]
MEVKMVEEKTERERIDHNLPSGSLVLEEKLGSGVHVWILPDGSTYDAQYGIRIPKKYDGIETDSTEKREGRPYFF